MPVSIGLPVTTIKLTVRTGVGYPHVFARYMPVTVRSEGVVAPTEGTLVSAGVSIYCYHLHILLYSLKQHNHIRNLYSPWYN